MGVKFGNMIQNFAQIIICYIFAFKNGWKLTLGTYYYYETIMKI